MEGFVLLKELGWSTEVLPASLEFKDVKVCFSLSTTAHPHKGQRK